MIGIFKAKETFDFNETHSAAVHLKTDLPRGSTRKHKPQSHSVFAHSKRSTQRKRNNRNDRAVELSPRARREKKRRPEYTRRPMQSSLMSEVN